MSILKEDDNLGFVYIAEASNEGYENFDKYDVIENHGLFMVRFTQVLQSFDVLNRNNRYYDGDNVWECIQAEKIQSQLAHNGLFMELDHPMQKYKDKPLSAERIQSIDYDRRCAVIKNLKRVGNLIEGTITTTNNDKGVGIAKDIVGIGYRPMASCRAIATMIMKNNKPYVQMKRFITYDMVSYASHKEADTVGGYTPINKQVRTVKESVSDKIKSKALPMIESVNNDIVIPLKDILTNLGNTDVTTQVVLESFNLDTDNIIGVTKNHKQIIIENDGNYIYTNINKDSVNKVNDFFSSF